jgi:hypothetical protein
MSTTELDLALKLRMMRYLWNLGYFVRRNVRVPRQNFSTHEQATDVDVFGMKIDDHLECKMIICDCKSGSGVATAGRLFWLSGVMSYFDVPSSYFVRTQMSGFEYITLADRLRIVPLSADQLTRLENAYGVDKDRYFASFCKEQTKVDIALSELDKDLRQVRAYMTSRFWEDEPHEQIASIMASCRRVKDSTSLTENAKTFILLNLMSMLCMSVLAFSKNALSLPVNVVEDHIRQQLLGGGLETRQRRAILESFYDFMTTEVGKRYKQKYPVTRASFLEGLTPYYSKYLIDLVLSICQDPRAYVYVYRLLDILAFDTVLNGRPMNASDIVGPYSDTNILLVARAARDFHAFVQRAKVTTDAVSKLFESEMQKLVT